MRIVRLPASFLFLLLCLQLIIPAQLWHELCDHHDTHSCIAPQNGLSVSEQHVHCLVLELTLPGMLYTHQDFQLNTFHKPYSYFEVICPSEQLVAADQSTVRGPPTSFLLS